MKILVTGGAGFLGSHLIDALLDQGHEIACLDNQLTGDYKNIHYHQHNSSLHIWHQDVTLPVSRKQIIDFMPEQIYNLACPASPIHYQKDPVRTVRTCVMGALNMLDLARDCNARIFQASTSEVYGDPEIHPQSEGYRGNVNQTGPRACYDEGKRCAETLFYDFHRQYDLDIRVARIFNTYGPRMHPNDGRVVSNFIVQALANQPITIYGDGKQSRSFCYVSDLIIGMIAIMNYNGEGQHLPMNIGNDAEFTIKQLAEQVIGLTDSRSEIIHHALPEDDPLQRKPDLGRIRKNLAWQSKVELNSGLIHTIDYFRSLHYKTL